MKSHWHFSNYERLLLGRMKNVYLGFWLSMAHFKKSICSIQFLVHRLQDWKLKFICSCWFFAIFSFPMHYALETFKMWSLCLTLLEFDNLNVTQILREIQFWWIQTVQNVNFGNFRYSELWIFGKFGTWKMLKFTKIKIQNL